jgi:uridine kinase
MIDNRFKVSFIGVAGGSASGKSSITDIIKRYFADLKTVSVVNVDLFYKNLTDDIVQRFNGKVNWDDPFMIDE